jgi:flagellar assembly factor FliW
MSVTFESIRFGTVEIPAENVIEFPFGLIGLGGLRYALIDRNPGTGFLWLHSVDEPGLALPVVSPYQFFSTFSLQMSAEDHERTGIEDTAAAKLYVTVRATPNPLDITANLRAPLVIYEGRGYQVINTSEDAPLQAPLFTLQVAPPSRPVEQSSGDPRARVPDETSRPADAA